MTSSSERRRNLSISADKKLILFGFYGSIENRYLLSNIGLFALRLAGEKVIVIAARQTNSTTGRFRLTLVRNHLSRFL